MGWKGMVRVSGNGTALPGGQGTAPRPPGGRHPLALRGEARCSRVTATGGGSSPVLAGTKHHTARGIKVPPMGTGAVLGGHAHVVLEPKTFHHLPDSRWVWSGLLPTVRTQHPFPGSHPPTPPTLLPQTALLLPLPPAIMGTVARGVDPQSLERKAISDCRTGTELSNAPGTN